MAAIKQSMIIALKNESSHINSTCVCSKRYKFRAALCPYTHKRFFFFFQIKDLEMGAGGSGGGEELFGKVGQRDLT